MVQELNEGYEFYIFCSNTDLHGLPLHITDTDKWLPFNAYTKVWYAGRQDRTLFLQIVAGLEHLADHGPLALVGEREFQIGKFLRERRPVAQQGIEHDDAGPLAIGLQV